MTLKATSLRILASVLLGLGLSACGAQSNTHERATTITVNIGRTGPLAQIPLDLAQSLGLFHQQGIQVLISQHPPSDIVIGPAGRRWPIYGVIGQGINGLVVSPEPDPGFRLAGLEQVPIAYPQSQPSLAWAFRGLMRTHAVRDTLLEPLGTEAIIRLWQAHHLAYVLVDAALWQRLHRTDPSATLLAVLSASMGPTPTVTVSGQNRSLPQFLAALNLSLWYLTTHRPKNILPLLPRCLRTPQTRLFIQLAERYQWYAASTVPTRQDYQRGVLFWRTLGVKWPDYYRAVDTRPSLVALSLTP